MSIRTMEPQPDLVSAQSRERAVSGEESTKKREKKSAGNGAMRQLLTANVRAHARRYVATGVAVAISMAFVVIALALGAGMSRATTNIVRDQYQGADVVVEMDWSKTTWDNNGNPTGPELSSALATVQGVNGVGTIGLTSSNWIELRADKRLGTGVSILNPEPFARPDIVEGALPATADEIAISTRQADQLGVHVGDSVTAVGDDAAGAGLELRVSGLWKPGFISEQGAVLTADGIKNLVADSEPSALLVASTQGELSDTDQDALAQSISNALGDGAIVALPAHTVIDEELTAMNIGDGTTTVMLLVFPLIAVGVAAIVVATTFQIVLQQRRRELALLRTLGASATQIRQLIRREALVVGAVSSAIGVLLGFMIGAVVLSIVGITDGVTSGFAAQNGLQLVGVWVLGTLLTFLIGMRPATGISRISPIEALAPIDEFGAAARKNHRTRVTFGVVLALIGGAGIALGIHSTDKATGFFIAFASGVISLVAALLLSSVFLPKLTYALGAPFRGVVAKMAKANTLRNPDRTASTGTAIVVGVTLITMMLVAAGSMRETLLTEVDDRRPFDMDVQDAQGHLTSDIISRVSAVKGVAAVQDIYAGAAVQSDEHTVTFFDPATVDPQIFNSSTGTDKYTWGIVGQPDLNAVAHSPISVVGDDEVRVNPDSISVAGLDASTGSLTFCSAAGECRELRIVSDERVDTTQLVVSPHTLEQLDPARERRELYVKLTDDADVVQVQSDILSIDDTLLVSGAAAERALYTQMINTVLAVVIGLLAVSVLVALVGVANTLSLSVAERTRENGLMRALGFTKRHMQRMLAAESLYIGMSGALVGVGLGILFGCIGALALPIDVAQTVIVIPWLQILGVIAVAIVATLLASWWPGRKAARTSPVEALAQD